MLRMFHCNAMISRINQVQIGCWQTQYLVRTEGNMDAGKPNACIGQFVPSYSRIAEYLSVY